MSNFAERLRMLRGNRQSKEFAKAAGISAGSLSAYENGTSHPSLRVLSRISENLRVSAEWLLTGSDDSQAQQKICDASQVLEVVNSQVPENTESYKIKPATVAGFGAKNNNAPGAGFGEATSPTAGKTSDASEVLENQNLQPSENTESAKIKSSDVGAFAAKLDQALEMNQQLQLRMLALMDRQSALMDRQGAMMDQLSALQAENAALREERAELKAALAREREERLCSPAGAPPFLTAPGAPAAPDSASGSEGQGSPLLVPGAAPGANAGTLP